MSFSLFSNAFLPKPRTIRALVLIAFAVVLGFSCSPEEALPKQRDLEIPPVPKGPIRPFHVEAGSLHYQGLPVTYKGVNAMQTFGLVDPGLMNDWKVGIVREFIGNLREQPIQGAALQASDGKWYHSLQKIVDQNRAHKRINLLPLWLGRRSGQANALHGPQSIGTILLSRLPQQDASHRRAV